MTDDHGWRMLWAVLLVWGLAALTYAAEIDVPETGLRLDAPIERVGGFIVNCQTTTGTQYRLVRVEADATTVGGPVVHGDGQQHALVVEGQGRYWLYVEMQTGERVDRYNFGIRRTRDIFSLILPPVARGDEKNTPQNVLAQLTDRNNDAYVDMLDKALLARGQNPLAVREALQEATTAAERDSGIYTREFRRLHPEAEIHGQFVNEAVSCQTCH